MLAFQSDHMRQDCIESCTACEKLCREAIEHARAQGSFGEREFTAVLAVCADICGTSARALIGGSDVHVHTCRACAAVCERAAKLCSEYPGDAVLRACASACNLCARCCRDMVHAH